VGTPLRVVRGAALPAADERDDGLLVFDGAAERPASQCASTPALGRDQLRLRLRIPAQWPAMGADPCRT
jgi:hypothetical protein